MVWDVLKYVIGISAVLYGGTKLQSDSIPCQPLDSQEPNGMDNTFGYQNGTKLCTVPTGSEHMAVYNMALYNGIADKVGSEQCPDFGKAFLGTSSELGSVDTLSQAEYIKAHDLPSCALIESTKVQSSEHPVNDALLTESQPLTTSFDRVRSQKAADQEPQKPTLQDFHKMPRPF